MDFYRKPRPEHKSFIAMISYAIFMLYFCVLRDENDIDDFLKRDLYDILGGRAFLIEEAIADGHERVFGPAYKISNEKLPSQFAKCKQLNSIKILSNC